MRDIIVKEGEKKREMRRGTSEREIKSKEKYTESFMDSSLKPPRAE